MTEFRHRQWKYTLTVIRWVCLVWIEPCHFYSNSSHSTVFWYQWTCLQKLVLTSWMWVTYIIYDVTMERTSLNTFVGNFQQKITGKSVTYIIFILFHLEDNKTKMLWQIIVTSWHLVDKAPYSIDNKLDQSTYNILNTAGFSTMHTQWPCYVSTVQRRSLKQYQCKLNHIPIGWFSTTFICQVWTVHKIANSH